MDDFVNIRKKYEKDVDDSEERGKVAVLSVVWGAAKLRKRLTTTNINLILKMNLTLKKQKPPMTEKELLAAKDRLSELSQIQAQAREEELSIREYLKEKLYPKDKVEGAHSFELFGIKGTVTRNLRYTIDKGEFARFKELYPKRVDEFFRLTPEVSVSAYKKERELMDGFVTTKESPASVSFK